MHLPWASLWWLQSPSLPQKIWQILYSLSALLVLPCEQLRGRGNFEQVLLQEREIRHGQIHQLSRRQDISPKSMSTFSTQWVRSVITYKNQFFGHFLKWRWKSEDESVKIESPQVEYYLYIVQVCWAARLFWLPPGIGVSDNAEVTLLIRLKPSCISKQYFPS